jgi:hypothetical protein
MSTSTSSKTEISFLGENRLDTMRSIDIAFTIRWWEPEEVVTKIYFDGIEVTPANGQTNINGAIKGAFKIPPDVPAGKKLVEFVGSLGSSAAAQYEGSQTIMEYWETKTNTTVIQYFTPVPAGVDPLAQTFTLPETIGNVQLAAIDLIFTNKGSGRIVAQIRGVSNGVPNQEVLAQTYVDPADIILTGNPTRIRFDAPVYLNAGTEYAIVVLCDDTTAALGLAQLGAYDSAAGIYVTSQPYSIGVMLSSSNASTWTPHNDRDLTFRLLRAEYTQTSRVVSLGAVAVEAATDLILLAPASRPETAARVSYRLAIPDPDGGAPSLLTVDSGQRVQLAQAVTGEIAIEALLEGTSRVAPIVWPGSQLISGRLAESGDYISRAILAGQNSAVTVIFEAQIPAGASVTPTVAGIDAGDTWQAMTLTKTRDADEGFKELTYKLNDTDELMIHVKLALTGNPAARPRVKNLRVIVT